MKYSVFKHYEWLIAGMWAIFAAMIYLQFLNVSAPIEALLFVLAVVALTFPISTYLSKALLRRAIKNENIRIFIMPFIVCTLILAFFYALLINGFVSLEKKDIFPASTMFMGIKRPFYIEFLGNILPAFVPNLAFCAIRFFEEHYKLLQEQTRLRQIYLEDQLHLLRNQINPHIMFNVMNHIHILLKKNVVLADVLLLRYSDVLRYQLYECTREVVVLEKEIDYLKDVVEVEKIRWGNELNVKCFWHIENGRKEIGPLLLIPFIENAFKHVSRLPLQTGFVRIDIQQKNTLLTMKVENSKTNFLVSKPNASGLGLENVKKRLNILYPERHKLTINDTETLYAVRLIINL